jgi:hypothetical protein
MDRELVDLLRGSIRSVWNLELLLFMARNAQRGWRADDLVRELRASDFIVSEGLQTLQTAGLASPAGEGTHRYLPASGDLDRLVQQLERQYRERPQSVTRAIFSAPNDKLQTFADAFRLKRD